MTKLELEQCMDAHGKDDKIHMEGNPKSYLLSVAVRLWKKWMKY